MTKSKRDFDRIEAAIHYIKNNFKDQPDLEEIAKHIHLSPFHFQKIFTDFAGVSPKKFLQFISINHAKKMLENRETLLDTALDVGLSGTSRLHDLFIKIEGMTPGEYKNKGEGLIINYDIVETIFGEIAIASTAKGICHLSFAKDEKEALKNIRKTFLNATLKKQSDALQKSALRVFEGDLKELEKVKLHLKGTDFQLKVWEALLKIPLGSLSTYGKIAKEIKNPKASRAVGTAISDNPVAFLIPCHRVIRASGELGGYHWGIDKKSAIIGFEAANHGLT